MEYIEQVEKTVDILSFLLSKIPSNIEGESSWLINSLHVFISELQLHQLSKGFGRIDNSNVDEKLAPSACYGSHLPIEENLIVSATDESLNNLKEFPMISSNVDCPQDEPNSLQTTYEQVAANPDITRELIYIPASDLKPKKSVKRKYKRKIKTENNCDGLQVKHEYGPETADKNNSSPQLRQGTKLKLSGTVKSYKYYCCLCKGNFETEHDLENHDFEHHCIKDTYKCFDCDFTAVKKKSLIEHCADKHKESKTFKRPVSNKAFVGYGYRKLKYCRHCDQIFFSVDILRKHIYQLHNIIVPKNNCLMCDREFEHERSLKSHMAHGHIGLKIKCNGLFCGELFDTDEEYQIHFLEKHEKADEYTCHICGKVFCSNQRASFNRHVDSHGLDGKQKPEFECKQCPKAFFFETDLNKHLTSTTHSGRTFPCSICDYKAFRKRGLQNHIAERHSTERPFECEICGKGFSNEKYFQKHQNVHDSTRKFECSVCNKKFKRKMHLNTHCKIHRQEYTAQCEYCDAKFVQRQNLKPHIKKHHTEMVKPDEKIMWTK